MLLQKTELSCLRVSTADVFVMLVAMIDLFSKCILMMSDVIDECALFIINVIAFSSGLYSRFISDDQVFHTFGVFFLDSALKVGNAF